MIGCKSDATASLPLNCQPSQVPVLNKSDKKHEEIERVCKESKCFFFFEKKINTKEAKNAVRGCNCLNFETIFKYSNCAKIIFKYFN